MTTPDQTVVLPPTVLIVEDEGAIALDLQDVLESLGYRVPRVATTAQEALAAIEQHQPDLLLLDIRLADGSSGIDVAEQVQTQRAIPIIFLTAHADPATVARAEMTQPYHYLLKPFNEREIAIAVRLALAKSASDRQLRMSERRFLTTLQSIADGVIVTDAQSRITYINPAASTLTGWTDDEAQGQLFHEVFAIQSPQLQQDNDLVARVLAEKQTLVLPPATVLHRRDRAVREVATSIAPLRDDDGATQGAVLVFQDVTEHIRAEEARQQIERKMVEAQRLESLGIMAGGIAHDFNNLLTIILGYADLARSEIDPTSNAYTYLQHILTGTRRAADLTSQMLAYAGKGPFRCEQVDVNTLVREIVDLVHVSISSQAQLVLQLAAHLPLISGDSTQIRQIILNLLTNAAESTDTRSDTVMLTTAMARLGRADLERCQVGSELDPGDYVSLEVLDTGRGMDVGTMAHIFDPFFSTKFQGRGLGLAAVLGIVQRHQGAIQVSSNLGEGTLMRIYLPVSAGSEQSAPPSPGSVSVVVFPVSTATAEQRPTILVIDDELAVRELAARMLKQLGYDVHMADNGREGLKRLAAGIPNLRGVLLDLTMPLMNGFDVAQVVQVIHPGMPIILMSGYPPEEVKQQHPQLGLRSFLQKPFSLAQLQSALGLVLVTT